MCTHPQGDGEVIPRSGCGHAPHESQVRPSTPRAPVRAGSIRRGNLNLMRDGGPGASEGPLMGSGIEKTLTTTRVRRVLY